MSISSFVDATESVQSLEQLFKMLSEAAEARGFNTIGYMAANYREPVNLVEDLVPLSPDSPSETPAPIAAKYPAAWGTRYFERKYYRIDPTLIHAPSFARPYLWRDLEDLCDLDDHERSFFREASDFGLQNGVSVPIHRPRGRVAVVSFASDATDVRPEREARYLGALAAHFDTVFTALARGPDSSPAPVQLTPRELECLRWSARGKTSWDIGVILGISESTAAFHLANAMKKLGAASRTVAVVKALRLHLIDLPAV
jgi:LuxR family quorum-sensing system transcriptional regulator CciR